MSNYNSLKTIIDANIKQNGNQEITGQILNSVLNQMVNILGAGYQFAGVATLDPATNPGTPDAKVFYIANGKGKYTNFGGIEVTEDDVVVLYYDTKWHKEATGIASQEKITELAGKVDEKQDALTLTVKDNGNIVLANIQGQSKEFMPATPSGDPMHYAYVAAGAEYNDTGADIVKTAPWADMIDDDYTGEYGKTVVHKAGYWYLNGLGDITNEEIRRIYQLTSAFPESLYIEERFKELPIRTNFFSNKSIGGWGSAQISALIYTNYSIISFAFTEISAVSSNFHTFSYTSVRHIIGTISSLQSSTSTFEGSTITSVKINRLRINLSIPSPNLSCKSVLYMINNEAATSAITITLHADVYNRCMANADILAALQAHTNVSLASA